VSEEGTSRAPFDSHASDYEAQLMKGLAASGELKAFFARGRVHALRAWWQRAGCPDPQRIVDYGCGIGDTSALLAEAFPESRILGVDPSERCVARARQEFSSERIAFAPLRDFAPAGKPADLIYLNGVVHHVPHADRPRLFKGLADWLGPGGVVALFENNPWNPGTRLVMRRIPFDRDAIPVRPAQARRLLRAAGLTPHFTGFYFYFPRWLRSLRPVERWLVRVPLGAQYGVFAVSAEGSGSGAA
jgi:SAM-dependent methyltransferase